MAYPSDLFLIPKPTPSYYRLTAPSLQPSTRLDNPEVELEVEEYDLTQD